VASRVLGPTGGISFLSISKAYGNDSLREFSISPKGGLPADKDAYAIFLPSSLDFITEQKLELVYQNDESHAAVAIRRCPAAARSN